MARPSEQSLLAKLHCNSLHHERVLSYSHVTSVRGELWLFVGPQADGEPPPGLGAEGREMWGFLKLSLRRAGAISVTISLTKVTPLHGQGFHQEDGMTSPGFCR